MLAATDEGTRELCQHGIEMRASFICLWCHCEMIAEAQRERDEAFDACRLAGKAFAENRMEDVRRYLCDHEARGHVSADRRTAMEAAEQRAIAAEAISNKLATALRELLENKPLHVVMGNYVKGQLSHANYLEEQLRGVNSALQEWDAIAAQPEVKP